MSRTMDLSDLMASKQNKAASNIHDSTKSGKNGTRSMDISVSNKNGEKTGQRMNVIVPRKSSTIAVNLVDVPTSRKAEENLSRKHTDLSSSKSKKYAGPFSETEKETPLLLTHNIQLSLEHGPTKDAENKGKGSNAYDPGNTETKEKTKKAKLPDLPCSKTDEKNKGKKTVAPNLSKPKKNEGFTSEHEKKPSLLPIQEIVVVDKLGPTKDTRNKGRKSDESNPENFRAKKAKSMDVSGLLKDEKNEGKIIVDEDSNKSKKNGDVKTKEKKKANHPPVSKIILDSIRALKDSKGSSLPAICKYIGAHYNVEMNKLKPHVNRSMKMNIEKGILTQVSGRGLVGKFKIRN